jgi:hypothetical protein
MHVLDLMQLAGYAFLRSTASSSESVKQEIMYVQQLSCTENTGLYTVTRKNECVRWRRLAEGGQTVKGSRHHTAQSVRVQFRAFWRVAMHHMRRKEACARLGAWLLAIARSRGQCHHVNR